MRGGNSISSTTFSEVIESDSLRSSGDFIITGWEDQRELFTESLFGAGQDEEILGPSVLDIDDSFGGADTLGSDFAYLAAGLASIIGKNYHLQDSTTMRQLRRRKRPLGQKPDGYEQKM